MERQMDKAYRRIGLLIGFLILLFFILFVINQTSQVVQLAERASPELGKIVFWFLLTTYGILFFIPVALYIRLPRPLMPPKGEEGPEFLTYCEALKKRLASNPLLKGRDLSGRQQLQEALAILARRADEIIEQAASTVFLSTAISQNGRLDGLLVLSVQSRMVWRIAQLYYQRPMLPDLIRLYANVAGTAFLASELDDMDISEQVEPVLSSTLGALAVTVPGIQVAASMLVNSVLAGTANAFFTLRVGVLAKRYCGSLVVAEKRSLRRAASAEAAKLLGSVVRQGTARVSKSLWEVSKGKVSSGFSSAKEYAKATRNSILLKMGLRKAEEEET